MNIIEHSLTRLGLWWKIWTLGVVQERKFIGIQRIKEWSWNHPTLLPIFSCLESHFLTCGGRCMEWKRMEWFEWLAWARMSEWNDYGWIIMVCDGRIYIESNFNIILFCSKITKSFIVETLFVCTNCGRAEAMWQWTWWWSCIWQTLGRGSWANSCDMMVTWHGLLPKFGLS